MIGSRAGTVAVVLGAVAVLSGDGVYWPLLAWTLYLPPSMVPLVSDYPVLLGQELRPLPARQVGYRQFVPRVSAFYGIVIYMNWNEKDHPVAHFHAYHAGRRASVSMDGEILAGRLEPRALQFVREWAGQLRQDEILANWERARRKRATARDRAAVAA